MSVTPDDERIAASANVTLDALRVVDAYRNDAKIQRLLGYDAEYNDIEVSGVAFPLAGSDPDAHIRIIADLDTTLTSFGYAAFLTEHNKLNDTERDTLHEYLAAVIKRDDALAPVRIRNAAAFNYDLTNDDILAKLESWNAELGVQIVGADYDWIALRFEGLPKDLKAFAADIYDFCPDVVGQGTAPVYEAMDDAELKAAGYTLEAGMDSEEGGLALLAQQIAKTKSLHLWWD